MRGWITKPTTVSSVKRSENFSLSYELSLNKIRLLEAAVSEGAGNKD